MNSLTDFLQSQLAVWQLASDNFKALERVEVKQIAANGMNLILQFNPARIVSSSAKVDQKSLAERPCFLCSANLPKEQESVVLSERFTLLVNPFPILQKHFTIVNTQHTPQRIVPYLEDLLEISQQLGEEFTLFYNGAKCGASAPDHMHYQAGNTEQFPLWNWLENTEVEPLCEHISVFENHVCGLVIEGDDKNKVMKRVKQVIESFSSLQPQEDEPMLNVLAKYGKVWKVILFPREKHRPTQYFEEGEKQFLLSPASVDFGGLVAVARKEDFNRIDAELLKDVFGQLRLNVDAFGKLKEKIRQL